MFAKEKVGKLENKNFGGICLLKFKDFKKS